MNGLVRFAETVLKHGRDTYGEKHAPLVVEIVKFFQTQKSPVPAAETIELFAFMETADESKRQGGKPVSLAEVLAKAGKKP